MTKNQTLLVNGIFIILAGILLIVFQQRFTPFIQYTLAAFLTISAAFAFITSLKNKNKMIRFRYHELHALSLVIYCFILFGFSGTTSFFLYITSFFMIYYGISEMIFCVWLFNVKLMVNFTVLIIRLVMGLGIYLGAVLVQMIAKANQSFELVGYGIIFMAIGVHVLLYKPVIKKLETPIII